MQVRTHIITTIPVFEVDEPLGGVVEVFMENTYSHIAIVDKGKFLGVLDENDLEDFSLDKKIEDFRYNLESFFVREDASWFDVLETFARNEANLVPVLGKGEEVLGYYDITDIVSVFIDMPFFTEPGGILVVSKEQVGYSFSEVVQIVESNNSKFIGGFISGTKDGEVQITIKINGNNMNEVLHTFRRYDYTVLFGNVGDRFIDDLKRRSNYLDKYLNV
ncbi:MAG: acetoin utilization protein acuB [Maribacter sp.]|nr:MAG: acetoin utilization protein acuB [Maribacter sp.]